MLLSCQKPASKLDVQGHRGCRGLLPENSIEAFLLATNLGVSTLELDVVISADGKVVVSHEAWLNPEICTDTSGQNISNSATFNLFTMPYAEIIKCDCGSKKHPRFLGQKNMPTYKPLLTEVIIAVKNLVAENKTLRLPNFNVEIKTEPDSGYLYHPEIDKFVQLVMAVLDENLPPEKYNLQSFDVRVLQKLHNDYPKITLAFLVEGDDLLTSKILNQHLEKLGFVPQIYSCYFKMLSANMVAEIQDCGMLVIPWTVNEPEDLSQVLNWGVDGIISDYPDRLINMLPRN